MSKKPFVYGFVVGLLFAAVFGFAAANVSEYTPPPEPVENVSIGPNYVGGGCILYGDVHPNAPGAGDRLVVETGSEILVYADRPERLEEEVDPGAALIIYRVEIDDDDGFDDTDADILFQDRVNDQCQFIEHPELGEISG